ncbi:MAG: exodeoxyribonuclease VII large subunit, partial [Nitrospirota bacterium]
AGVAAVGWCAADTKRPLPALPRRVGVVTSPTGAVIRDLLVILARRFANLHIIINPSPVQGPGAAERIAEAVDELNALKLVDVIIVARGGGSLEDLWAFNDERVARAIARSAAPVISAVGHETDVTIADFVADLRAPTPSAAAELVVRTKGELLDRLEQLRLRAARSLRELLDRRRACVQREQRALIHPRRSIEAALLRADELDGRLRAASARLLGHRREFLRMRIAQLHQLSPLAILGRGYSIAQRMADGAILRSARAASPGERIRVVLHEGELDALIEQVRQQRKWPLPTEMD